MNIQISPQVSQWISIVGAAAGGIAALSPSVFPDYIPIGATKNIIQTAGLVSMIGGIIQATLHRYSSAEAGPGVTPPNN